jgi:hypothetical protein
MRIECSIVPRHVRMQNGGHIGRQAKDENGSAGTAVERDNSGMPGTIGVTTPRSTLYCGEMVLMDSGTKGIGDMTVESAGVRQRSDSGLAADEMANASREPSLEMVLESGEVSRKR